MDRCEATCETTPRHIWMALVCEGCVAKGVSDDGLAAGGGELRDRMNRAYVAGEAVWMVVDEMVLRIRQRKLAARSWESDMRRASAAVLRGGAR